MTLDTVLLLVVSIYLALVAYGVAGAGRRLAGPPRLITDGLLVLLPPGLLAGTLAMTEEGPLVAQWWRLFAGMPVAGAIVAVLADRIGRAAAR
ncbi:hypothetical protein [Sphingomonas nostoxanthinifaciens]|uniref:hypothetical protein n=1 Tax=Sphingomonas nostoxanthinifaciens TaxID=2872652 RepID=UPI001CC1DD7B|nr:hypothetical protein [Sphingomonas nostoxanthinifaciens]UAK25261.1 hypothetical protein K8P63_03440 [Sphingomonas nostoxanthinifaciens]